MIFCASIISRLLPAFSLKFHFFTLPRRAGVCIKLSRRCSRKNNQFQTKWKWCGGEFLAREGCLDKHVVTPCASTGFHGLLRTLQHGWGILGELLWMFVDWRSAGVWVCRVFESLFCYFILCMNVSLNNSIVLDFNNQSVTVIPKP